MTEYGNLSVTSVYMFASMMIVLIAMIAHAIYLDKRNK